MRAALYGVVIYVALAAGSLGAQTQLEPEKPRLVPDPQALESSQLPEEVPSTPNQVPNSQSSVGGNQTAVGHQPSFAIQNQSKHPSREVVASSSREVVASSQGVSEPGEAATQSSASSTNNAWKQDPAAQGGNFKPDSQALQSAQELDEKVGQEQAAEAAEDQRQGEKDKDKRKAKKKKYDIEKIGDRGVGGGMNFYSLNREIAMGAEMAQEVERTAKFFTDPVVNEYVNRLAQNLVRNSDAQVPFKVKIIDSEELNAFALPGGHFYVNTGMILATESEAELAGIMAHEIAHVAARHATKNATKQQIWNMASIPLMFVGGPAAMAVRNVAQIAVPMSFMKFSRNAEREADLLGMEYEYVAGYDPVAMVNFFERLQSEDKKKPNFVVRAFQSHPFTDDRLKRAQKTIEELLPPKDDYLITTSEYVEMKERLSKLLAGRLKLEIYKNGGRDKPVLRTNKNNWHTEPAPSLCETIEEACPRPSLIQEIVDSWRDEE